MMIQANFKELTEGKKVELIVEWTNIDKDLARYYLQEENGNWNEAESSIHLDQENQKANEKWKPTK